MAKRKTVGKGADKRRNQERRSEDRRQAEHVTMKALFHAYGFKEERRRPDRRDGEDRRADDTD